MVESGEGRRRSLSALSSLCFGRSHFAEGLSALPYDLLMVELVVLRCSLLTPLFYPPKEGVNSCSSTGVERLWKVGKWEKQEGRGTTRSCFKGGLG